MRRFDFDTSPSASVKLWGRLSPYAAPQEIASFNALSKKSGAHAISRALAIALAKAEQDKNVVVSPGFSVSPGSNI
jgi:hypothetical protein